MKKLVLKILMILVLGIIIMPFSNGPDTSQNPINIVLADEAKYV